MDNYSKVLTFFMENGVQLTTEQIESLKEEFLNEGLFSRNKISIPKPTDTGKYLEQYGLTKSSVTFLGAPIYVDASSIRLDDWNDLLGTFKKDSEEMFKSWMKDSTGGKQFFTKNNYGRNIRDINKYNIKHAVMDISGNMIQYTVIGNFKEGDLPFSAKVKIDVSNANNPGGRVEAGNIRVNK